MYNFKVKNNVKIEISEVKRIMAKLRREIKKERENRRMKNRQTECKRKKEDTPKKNKE